jgi:4-hydroxy-tetrahydrodipicolinate synthase
VVIKEALTMIGIDAGPAVAPVGPMTPENREKLRKVLVEMGMVKA